MIPKYMAYDYGFYLQKFAWGGYTGISLNSTSCF